MARNLFPSGRIPPAVEVLELTVAQVIRPEPFGEPDDAFQVEEIPVPELGPLDALVLVMAAGINYNNVWAARGVPVDVTRSHAKLGEPDDFHIGGSDASGIVYSVGRGVDNVAVGDHVVIHCGQWDPDDPVVNGGRDAGGLGSMAIQVVRELGGVPVAVVSSESKGEFCKKLGAIGVINRREFEHWGMLPHWRDTDAFREWSEGAKRFGKAFRDALGEKRNPRIVFEHPGEETIPTSIFMCDTGGMVVICAGTTGYNAVVDLRYLWMRQKRLQGSHFANDEQAAAFNRLVVAGRIDPCPSRTFTFDEIGSAHQLMSENRHPEGNMAALVSAPKAGLTGLP